MKTIIAGNQSIVTASLIEEALRRVDWSISEVVCTDVNQSILKWVGNKDIQYKIFETETEFYQESAKHVRNARMAKYSDALIAIWDGKTGDVSRLISEAKELGLRVVVFLDEELRNKKGSNPIKNNPIFGDQAERYAQTGRKESLSTKTIELNGKKLVVYEDAMKNQPILNLVAELVDEVKRLRG